MPKSFQKTGTAGRQEITASGATADVGLGVKIPHAPEKIAIREFLYYKRTKGVGQGVPLRHLTVHSHSRLGYVKSLPGSSVVTRRHEHAPS